MAANPRVSVVMPAYNRAGMIGEALESVLAQTYADLEIIVVDDGSTDDTREVVQRFGPPVRYVYTDHVGAGQARNVGIEEAKGTFLCYCDSDDIQLPYRIAAQVHLLDRFPDAAMVSGDFKTYADGKVVADSHLRRAWLGPLCGPLESELRSAFPHPRSCEELQVPVPGELKSRLVYAGSSLETVIRMNLAWGCAQMLRLSAARAVGGHLPESAPYEDWYIVCQLAKSHPLVHLDAPLALYRLHPGQQVGKPRANTRGYLEVIEHAFHDDPQVYPGHRRLIDRLLGAAHVMLGEVEASDGNWDRAERAFLKAIRWNPRIKRAYSNLVVASAKNRIPGMEWPRLDRLFQKCLSPGARRISGSSAPK